VDKKTATIENSTYAKIAKMLLFKERVVKTVGRARPPQEVAVVFSHDVLRLERIKNRSLPKFRCRLFRLERHQTGAKIIKPGQKPRRATKDATDPDYKHTNRSTTSSSLLHAQNVRKMIHMSLSQNRIA